MQTDRRGSTFGSLGALVGIVLGFLLGAIVAWIYWSRSKADRRPADSCSAGMGRLVLEPAAPARVRGFEHGEGDLTG